MTLKNIHRNPAVKNIVEEVNRKILRANPYLEFYKNLFVKKNEKTQIVSDKYKVDFFPGYTTGIHYLDDGTHLCVALKNKILATESCLVKSMEFKGKKDELRDFFIGKSVKTNYKKNNKNYDISDINFDKNPGNTKFLHRGKEISMMDYYEITKGIKISDKTQFLFETNSKSPETGKDQVIYLVPELCILSGLDDSMIGDRNFMTELAKSTKFDPETIIKKTSKYLELVNCKEGKKIIIPGEGEEESKIITLPSPAEEMRNFTMEIANSKEFKTDYIKLPTIVCKKQVIKLNANNGTFQFKQEAEEINHIVEWICIYNKENYDSAGLLFETMTKAAKTFGITVKEPEWIETKTFDARDWIKEVESYLSKKKTIKMVVFLLSKKTKRLYKDIKTNSLVSKGYLSQVILRENLSDKKCMSVCSNLVKQINFKLGGFLYKINFDKQVAEKNLMIIGVDSSHISGKRTGVAMCATIDKQLTRYTNYEQIITEQTKSELCYAVANFLEKALKEYYKVNKSLPGGVVIYRQGVSAEQKKCLNDEVTQIIELLSGKRKDSVIQGLTIPYYYILVNKKTNLKFFEKDGNRFSNSNPGLIVHDCIVRQDIHEFYIQPQFVNEGCATPTNYHVAYGNLNIPEYIPHLTLGLCYNYANWQGPIRVPAPLKNAEKLSKLVSKYLKAELNQALSNTQCYL